MTKTREWHELRRKGIGGSDVPAILGLDPYKSPLEVYLEKRGELPPKKENKHTRRGEILEPVIADLFAEETGFHLRRSRFSHEHPKYPWMRANIDRMIISIDDRGPGLLEIKAPSIHAADLWQSAPPATPAPCTPKASGTAHIMGGRGIEIITSTASTTRSPIPSMMYAWFSGPRCTTITPSAKKSARGKQNDITV